MSPRPCPHKKGFVIPPQCSGGHASGTASGNKCPPKCPRKQKKKQAMKKRREETLPGEAQDTVFYSRSVRETKSNAETICASVGRRAGGVWGADGGRRESTDNFPFVDLSMSSFGFLFLLSLQRGSPQMHTNQFACTPEPRSSRPLPPCRP